MNQLTPVAFWDRYWQRVQLPVEIHKDRVSPSVRAILDTIERFLPRDSGCTILEIGGAPGQYLAYFARRFGYQAYALDYSPIGCQKLKENFRILGIPITVYHRDITGPIDDLPQFDIVYSLGLVEHFDDPLVVIQRHVELTRRGGWVIIGVPNFLGVNRWWLKVLRPDVFRWHNLSIMDVRRWDEFEQRFNLYILFRGYIGGWDPCMYAGTQLSKFQRLCCQMLIRGAQWMQRVGFPKMNSRWWSGYALGIYQR